MHRPGTAFIILLILFFSVAFVWTRYQALIKYPDDAGIDSYSATIRAGRIASPQPLDAVPLRPGRSAAPPEISNELISQVLEATVKIQVPKGVASGFFIGPGLLVTNYHVIEDGGPIEVSAGGQTRLAIPIRVAPTWDLALLRTDLPSPHILTLADGALTPVSTPVLTVGSAEGLEGSVRRGYVSFVGRTLRAVALIELDMAASQGNSGGPVVDLSGNVIGILNATLINSDRTSFAILSNYLFDGADALLRSFLAVYPLSDLFLKLQLRSLGNITEYGWRPRRANSSQAFVTESGVLAVVAHGSEPLPADGPNLVEVDLWIYDGHFNNLLSATTTAAVASSSTPSFFGTVVRSSLHFTLPLVPEVHRQILAAKHCTVEMECPALKLRRRFSIQP